MNTFKKKSLHAAVVAGLGALGVAGSANAVHVNPDGLGQVLIYPYYTARTTGGNALNSLISVVNTTTSTKIVKVRFLEGKSSREVLDFNLFLSPSDVWTGAVIPTADGARIATNDNSCVAPSDLFTRAANPLTDATFKNLQYTSAPWSAAGVSLDRTREGYVEIIDMATITVATVAAYAKHNAAGIPANCPALDAMDPGSGNAAAVTFPGTVPFIAAPTGGLAGRMSVINATTGGNFSFDATALDAWTTTQQYTAAGSTSPNLGNGGVLNSNVFVNGGVISATWLAGIDAVSATLMRDSVINEFVLDSGTVSSTDWVVTFPTKREYVISNVLANPPFANGFTATGSCDAYGVAAFNREENAFAAPGAVINPSPFQSPSAAISNLCWEANVLPFQAASLIGSTNTNALDPNLQAFVSAATSTAGTRTSVASGTVQGANGWFFMSFQNRTRQVLTPASASFNGTALVLGGASTQITGTLVGSHYGLPVVGMMLHNYTKSGVVSNYGGVLPHKFTRAIPNA